MRNVIILLILLTSISLAYAAPIDQVGACIHDGKCSLTADVKCTELNGKFYSTYLCTNPKLGNYCSPTMNIVNLSGSIHFLDSCGNPANLYFKNTTPLTIENYWSYALYEINVSAMEIEIKNETITVATPTVSKKSNTTLYLIIVAVVILAIGAVFLFIKKRYSLKKRKKNYGY